MTAVTHLTTAMASNAGSNFVAASGGITGTNISGTIFSNGISLSAAAGGVAGAALQGSGTYTQNTGTIQFANSNGVTFGLSNNGVMTASVAAAGGAQTGISGVIAGTQTQTVGTLSFSDANGITFGMSNSSVITASYNSTQFQLTGNYLTTAMLSNAGSNFLGTNTALTANGVSMTANSSGLSLNFPAFLTTADLSQNSSNYAKTGFTTTSIAGAVVAGTHDTNGLKLAVPAYLTTAQPVGAYLTTARASNDAVGLNTAGTNVTWTVNSSGLSINASGYAGTGTTFGGTNVSATLNLNSNGLNMSLSAPSAAAGNVTFSAGTTSSGLGAVTFSNSNGLTFGLGTGANAGVITASHNGITTARASNDAIGLNTAGTNVTWTVNSSGLSINAGGYAGIGVTTASTAGSDFAITHATNGLSMGVPKYLTTAMASNAATISNINISAGTTSTNASAFTFNNANGITFGLGTGASVGSITASHNGLTTARASNDGIGLNTAGTNVTWTVNSSGISFNGAAYLTTAMASNAGSNFVAATAAFNGTNASGTIASNGISISVAAPGGGGVTPAISGSNGSFSFSTVTFGNSNSINFYTTNGSVVASYADPDGWAINGNTAGAQSTYSATNGTFYLSGGNGVTLSQNGSTLGINVNTTPDFWSIVGNTAGASNTYAWTNDGLYLSGGNNITLSQNGSTLVISGGAGGGGGVAISAGGSNFTSGTVSFGNTNGASFITTNGSVALSFGTAPAGSIFFGNSNGITFGTSTVGASTTVTASYGNNATMSVYDFAPIGQFSSSQQTNSQVSIRYFQVLQDVSFTRLDIPMNLSLASTTTAATANVVFTSGAVIYTRNGSTLSPIVGALGTTTYTWASNTANYSSVIGGRYASFPIATALTPGEYYLGALLSTTNNASIGTATTALGNTVSVFVGSYLTAQNFAEFGNVTSASTTGLWPVQGLVSVNLTATNQTYQWSQISQSGAPGMRANLFFRLRNQ